MVLFRLQKYTHPGFVSALWQWFGRQPEVLGAVETTLWIVPIEGIASQTQVGVAVVALKAIAVQNQSLHSGLLHQVDGLLAEAALFGGSLFLEG